MRFVLDAAVMPRRQGQASAWEMANLVGQFLRSATIANGDIPPLGVSYDACTANSAVSAAFVGLMPEADMSKLAFFDQCRIQLPCSEIKFWPYGQLVWEGSSGEGNFPMLSFQDGWHIQKRVSLQSCSGVKMLCHGAVWTCLSGQMRQGIGSKTHSCSDTQSDRQAVARLSPCFTPRSWDSMGCNLHAFFGGLVAAISSASPGFSRLQLCVNALTLHYFLLLHCMVNKERFQSQWQSFSLALATVRSCGALCAATLASSFTTHEPRLLQELPIEFHFGRLKRHSPGSPSVKDLLYGMMLESTKQEQQLRSMDISALDQKQTTQSREPLTETQLKEAGKVALSSALQFQAFLMRDTSVESLYTRLRSWYPKEGGQMVI